MKMIRTFATVMAIAGLVYACGDDNDNGNGLEPDPLAELVGSYTADRWEYADPAMNFNPVDLVLLGGAATVTLSADGTFSATLTLPGTTTPIPFGGTIDIMGSTLTLTLSDTLDAGPVFRTPDDPLVFDNFTLSEPFLTLSASDTDFDFTLGMCGAPPCPQIPATLVLVLERS